MEKGWGNKTEKEIKAILIEQERNNPPVPFGVQPVMKKFFPYAFGLDSHGKNYDRNVIFKHKYRNEYASYGYFSASQYVKQSRLASLDTFVTHNTFDSFMTRNPYMTCTRVSGSHAAKLMNIVLDFDFHEETTKTINVDIREILERAMDELVIAYTCSNSDLLPPAFANFSGRGFHFWYCFESAPANFRDLYEAIANDLLDKMTDFLYSYDWHLKCLHPDRAASTNPDALIRVPNTYNTNAVHTDDIFPVMGHIKEIYAPHEKMEFMEYKKTLLSTQVHKRHVGKNEFVPYTNVFQNRMNLLLRLIEDRPEEGYRHYMTFIVYNSALMQFDEETAWNLVSEFNQELKSPLSDHDLEQSLRTSKRKGGYKITNDKIIKILDITEEEQVLYGIGKTRGIQHRYEKVGDPKYKRLSKEEKTLIEKMAKKGILSVEIAKRLGRNPSTISRFLKKEGIPTANQKKHEKIMRSVQKYDVQKTRQKFGLSSGAMKYHLERAEREAERKNQAEIEREYQKNMEYLRKKKEEENIIWLHDALKKKHGKEFDRREATRYIAKTLGVSKQKVAMVCKSHYPKEYVWEIKQARIRKAIKKMIADKVPKEQIIKKYGKKKYASVQRERLNGFSRKMLAS